MSWAARIEQRKDAGRVHIDTRYWLDRGRRDATVRSRSPATVDDSPQTDVQARGDWEPPI
jgi:hypothetical protein